MAKGGTVMRYFFTLLRLRIKAGAASRTFLLTAVCFLALSAVLSAALPDSSRMSLEVGLVAEGERAERVTARLMQNEDYRFIRYPGQEAAEQAVLAGKLHCGYLLGAEEPPIIALSTRSAYMRPLIDEIVFAAWFEEEMPVLAAERLTQNGFSDAQAHADFERLREEAEPMTVVLRQSGGQALDTLAESSVQPLLYAALVSAFLAISLAAGLLGESGRDRAVRQLASVSGHPLATVFAGTLSQALLNLLVLVASDLLLGALLDHPAYPLYARLAMLAILAVASALLTAVVSLSGRLRAVVPALLPPFLLVSILCSGALVRPELLPAGLGALRFLSPAWYALRLLSIL